MNKIQRNRKIKRPTVLIKRIHFPRNIKAKVKKSHSPLYQKLKINNHTLAKALSVEKQESQSLFSKNVELLSEVNELIQNCNLRDDVISNILTMSKNMMPTVTKLTEGLVKIISTCQAFTLRRGSSIRHSSSTTSRRESNQRLSTKSPAKGVVKPMVSGHTITKPTINLSRVNMQRQPNTNLSIINESASLTDRSLNLSSNDRRSRSQSINPRASVPDADVNISNSNNRVSARFSGRYSKRNSNRLSGIQNALNRNTDQLTITKSPRVALNDVSKLLRNSQTVNLRLLQEASNQINESNDEETSMECEDTNVQSASDSQETSENSDASLSNVEQQRTTNKVINRITDSSTDNQVAQNTTQNQSYFDSIDPREGPSWLTDDMSFTCQINNGIISNPDVNNSSNKRRRNVYFSENSMKKSSPLLSNQTSIISNELASLDSDSANRSQESNREEELEKSEKMQNSISDDDGKTINFRNFVTQRRGTNPKMIPVNNDDDSDSEFTLLMNIQQQVLPSKKHFDVNELLKMTPYKPLLNMKIVNSEQNEILDPSEFTSTVQITSKHKKNQDIDLEKSTVLLAPRTNAKERHSDIHEATTIELPRVSDILIESPAIGKERRKKKIARKLSDSFSMSEDEEKQKKKMKPKKKKAKSKDPSSAKVVLTKLKKTNILSDSVTDSEDKRNSNNISDSILVSAQQKEQSDSESSNASTCSRSQSSRPRRKKAPTTLKEPRLNKKLRRG